VLNLAPVQVLITGSTAKIGNGPVVGRYTQAFSSVVPPTNPKMPLHTPHRLAKFVWTDRPDGGRDLKLYSPPESTAPVMSITGLYSLPFVCIPVPSVFFSTLKYLTSNQFTTFLQSVTDSYDPVGPITGHVLGNFDLQGCLSASVYGSIETAKPVSLNGGFLNIGYSVSNTRFNFTAQPYPAK
jgi:hypothetical protein